MMAANIDVLYVHLMNQTEAQRVNLFTALAQLRAAGYDTPKVAPFLDPMVIWHQQPLVNLATEPGKDEFVWHYTRFFDQYFGATTDEHAVDYLARQAGQPILNTWHVKFNVSNLASLTRADVSNRLAAAHSVFTNGFVMVTTALNPPTLGFADEQVPQFEVNQYYRAVTFNGLQSVQLKGGYWDQNIRNPGSFLARAGGVPYRAAWNQVNRDTTRRIYIESWNEYDEGTGIYAADTVQPPYVAPANTGGNTDTWSATGDPFEYIKTTASGAAAFNDVPDQAAIVLWHNLPATLTPGETRTASVIVRNTGDASWTAAANYQLGQADTDTAFVANKRVLLDDDLDEIPVYGGIFRGRAKVFEITLTAPAALGTYPTHWRMRQGGAPFGAELTFPIEVKVKSPGTLTFSDLTQVADGTPLAVSVTTTPPGLNVALTYNGSPYPPTDAGIYIVSGTIDDADFNGQAGSLLIVTEDANLLAGVGGFEQPALGASVTTPPDVVDGVTIPGWRVFNVDSANVSFNASITDDASTGSRAIRLEVNNTGGGAAYALDQWAPSMHTPVQPGTTYRVTFDAARIAGLAANNLLFNVQEFDDAGGFLGNGLAVVRSVATTDYETHHFVYRPVNPATAGIGLFFGPLRGVVGTTTLSLDNIQLHVAPPLPNGGFEFSSIGTSAGGTGAFVNTTTFPGWRLFSVGSPPITSLTGAIVDAGGYTGGSPGGRAMRLAVANTGSPVSHDYGFDNDNARSPVVTGGKYTLSYDAALVEVVGSPLLFRVSIAEFNAAGGFTGTQFSYTPTLTADQTFHRHTQEYVITNPNTTQVVIAFRPVTTGSSTLVLDNVSFAPFVADTTPSVSSEVNGGMFELLWPESHLGWRAQFNTENVANPAAWNDIPGSEAANQFSLPVSPALPEVYFRLRRP